MLSSAAEKPFDHPDWLFEPKLDGMRALALVRDGSVRLVSRRGLEKAAQYPGLAAELPLVAREAVLDGEIVAIDPEGHASFELLQQRWGLTDAGEIREAERSIPVVYYVFDLLYLDGYDLRAVPLQKRKDLLECTIEKTEHFRLVAYVVGDGIATFKASIAHGFEGVIAKHSTSPYEAGKRSRYWLKIKATRTADLIVGGFSRGRGRRETSLGALAMGYYDAKRNLIFAGMVGTGLDDRMLDQLYKRLRDMAIEKCPFAEWPRDLGPVQWVRPEMVVEVKYAELTSAGILRAPVFLRLRPDKDPAEATCPKTPRAASSPARRTRELLAEPAPACDESHPAPDPARRLWSGATDIIGGTSNGREQVTKGEGQVSFEEDVAAVLEQLKHCQKTCTLFVQGHRLKVTNLDKTLWPAVADRGGLSKRDLIAYLCRVSPHLLLHIRDRPLTLIRYPNGIGSGRFFQKQLEERPEFVDTVRAPAEDVKEGREHLLCNNLPTLLWLGQLADLELHAWLARADNLPELIERKVWPDSGDERDSLLNYPDFILFDIDPYIYAGNEPKGAEPQLNRAAFAKCCEVAQWLKELLDQVPLASFVKTSGATGLHVYVPIMRHYTYATVRSVAGTVARHLERAYPKVVTTEWTVEKRTGRIFLDFNQNALAKSLAAPYSPRPLPWAPVSMPLRWEELPGVFPTDFSIESAPERVSKQGDPWANILDAKQDLSQLL